MEDPRGQKKIPTFENVLEARDRIEPYIKHTPVLTSSAIDEMVARSRDVILTMLRQGIGRAMTDFNRKTETLEDEEQ